VEVRGMKVTDPEADQRKHAGKVVEGYMKSLKINKENGLVCSK